MVLVFHVFPLVIMEVQQGRNIHKAKQLRGFLTNVALQPVLMVSGNIDFALYFKPLKLFEMVTHCVNLLVKECFSIGGFVVLGYREAIGEVAKDD